jgi:hypothetical protein
MGLQVTCLGQGKYSQEVAQGSCRVQLSGKWHPSCVTSKARPSKFPACFSMGGGGPDIWQFLNATYIFKTFPSATAGLGEAEEPLWVSRSPAYDRASTARRLPKEVSESNFPENGIQVLCFPENGIQDSGKWNPSFVLSGKSDSSIRKSGFTLCNFPGEIVPKNTTNLTTKSDHKLDHKKTTNKTTN